MHFIILDLTLPMELSEEEENFVRIAKILLDIVPKYLRQLFIEKWNRKYPNHKWKSDRASGEYLFNQLPLRVKIRKARGKVIDKLRSGNENEWNLPTLNFALLDSGLNLVQGCRPDDHRSAPLRISEEIDLIRRSRNDIFSGSTSTSCSSYDFMAITSRIKSTARNIFCNHAEQEIMEIVQLPLTTASTIEHLKRQLSEEKNPSDELEPLVESKLSKLI